MTLEWREYPDSVEDTVTFPKAPTKCFFVDVNPEEMEACDAAIPQDLPNASSPPSYASSDIVSLIISVDGCAASLRFCAPPAECLYLLHSLSVTGVQVDQVRHSVASASASLPDGAFLHDWNVGRCTSLAKTVVAAMRSALEVLPTATAAVAKAPAWIPLANAAAAALELLVPFGSIAAPILVVVSKALHLFSDAVQAPEECKVLERALQMVAPSIQCFEQNESLAHTHTACCYRASMPRRIGRSLSSNRS